MHCLPNAATVTAMAMVGQVADITTTVACLAVAMQGTCVASGQDDLTSLDGNQALSSTPLKHV